MRSLDEAEQRRAYSYFLGGFVGSLFDAWRQQAYVNSVTSSRHAFQGCGSATAVPLKCLHNDELQSRISPAGLFL